LKTEGRYAIIITVYIPRPPKFADPWTPGEETDIEMPEKAYA
jgi:hypothetical protein